MLLNSACTTCRDRKTKCDRAVPGCSACKLSGWDCPGYSRARYRHKTATQTARAQAVVLRYRISDPLSNPSSQLQALVVSHFTLPQSLIASYLPSRHYLHLVPRRIGSHQVLDDAIRCVCSVSQISDTGPNTSTQQQQAYHVALRSLSRAIQNCSKDDVSATLAATLLLQSFEQSTDLVAQKWLAHSNGATLLIKTFGPDGFTDDFSSELLLSHLGRITFECFRTRQRCFLDQPKWQSILGKLADQILRSNSRSTISLADNIEYHRLTAQLPGTVLRFHDVCESIERNQNSAVGGTGHQGPVTTTKGLLLKLERLGDGLERLPKSWLHESDLDRLTIAVDCAIASYLLYIEFMIAVLEDSHGSGSSGCASMCNDLAIKIRYTRNALHAQSKIAARLLWASLTDIWTWLRSINARETCGITQICDTVFAEEL